MHREAQTFFEKQLEGTLEGKAARAYLEDRGLDKDAIARFVFGFQLTQQRVSAARRVSNSKARNGILIQSAIFEISSRRFSFQRPFELLHEKSLRLAVHLDKEGSLLILFALLRRTFLLPRNGDAAFLRYDANRLGELALLHLHHEFENVPSHAASKAVINLLRRMHGKRGRLFRVERTQPG